MELTEVSMVSVNIWGGFLFVNLFAYYFSCKYMKIKMTLFGKENDKCVYLVKFRKIGFDSNPPMY